MGKTTIQPTVMSGSNSNGNWTKFADGTMICTKKVSITTAIQSPFGYVYESSSSLSFGNWPMSFIEAPEVSILCISNSYYSVPEALKGTSTTLVGQAYLMRPTPTDNVSFEFSVIGIGRWK